MTDESRPFTLEALPEHVPNPLTPPRQERPAEAPAEAPGQAALRQRLEEEQRRVELQQALTVLGTSDDLHAQAHQKARQMKDLSPEQQIQVLAALAFEKGAVFTVRVAEHLKDLAVLKQLHDYLVRDDVYPHLDIVK